MHSGLALVLSGPCQDGRSLLGFSPLTRPLEVDQGCARTVARAAGFVSRTASLRARCEELAGGRHGATSVAVSVEGAPGVQGACPRQGFGGGAPITMPAKPSLITCCRPRSGGVRCAFGFKKGFKKGFRTWV